MSRFRPATTTQTTVRREIISDDEDFFRSPFKSSPTTEYTTVRRRVGPTGVTTTTTTTTSPGRVRPVVTERRIHRALGSFGDSFDDDTFFDRTSSTTTHSRPSKLTRQVSGPADEFRVQFEVGEFKASEIEVKTRNGMVLVNAKHAGGAGSISKEFTQRCELPDGVDPLMIRACLSPLGILTIKAPRDMSKSRYVSMYERNVPVRMTML
ncbi:heat shock protein beta-7-like [Ornithodoros turicata]|uniref:heat shock protein beta-7-like n=1 Tax=Ornithodoros turicata TaxID=34597 RepID=UPI003139878F